LNTNQIEIELGKGNTKSSSFNGDSSCRIKNENNNETENVKDILNKYDAFINESKLKLKSLKTMSKYDLFL
jgi:hypothetical protein